MKTTQKREFCIINDEFCRANADLSSSSKAAAEKSADDISKLKGDAEAAAADQDQMRSNLAAAKTDTAEATAKAEGAKIMNFVLKTRNCESK